MDYTREEHQRKMTETLYKMMDEQGGSIDFKGAPITILPDNVTIDGDLNLNNTAIEKIPNNLTVNGNLYLNNTPIKSLPSSLIVYGNIDLRNSRITSLPDNFIVGGDLDLRNTEIKSLPNNLIIGGNLYLRNTKIKSLPDCLTVYGDLYHSNISRNSIPENLKIMGDIFINGKRTINGIEYYTIKNERGDINIGVPTSPEDRSRFSYDIFDFPQIYIFKNQKYKETYPMNFINDLKLTDDNKYKYFLNYLKELKDPVEIRFALSMILDERSSYMIELYYLNGLTQKEIANILNISVTRVQNLIPRCMRIMRNPRNQITLRNLALLSNSFNDNLNLI